MKKVLVILLAAMVVLAFGATAFAYAPAYDFEQYKEAGKYTESPYCKVLRTGSFEYYCNDPPDVKYTNHVSLAQWIYVKSTSTRMDWRVLKPGNYFTDSIHLEFNSNGKVDVVLSGFDDLTNAEGDVIEKYYWFGNTAPPTNIGMWYPASEMNIDFFIPEDEKHEICYLTLWEKIHVEPCDSACEYENSGMITFELKEQKDWIWIVGV